MKIQRAVSIPLILHDPYLSIWSENDSLYDGNTRHWSGAKQRVEGYVTVDNVVYCFMGNRGIHPAIEQKQLSVSATATEYVFENEMIELSVCFTTPLLLDDPVLMSRPCTYIDYQIKRKKACTVTIDLLVYPELVRNTAGEVIGGNYRRPDFCYGVMGKADQHPLGNSGDHITIDWGNVYLASRNPFVGFWFDEDKEMLSAKISFGTSIENSEIVFAYDDLLSICYFGEWRKAYWTRKYATILEAIGDSISDHDEVLTRTLRFDELLENKSLSIGGEDYAFLCNLSYRRAVAAHKLIDDGEGNLIFLSKENDSNGCIGTVDISYPSSPLFLLYNAELVKGMLRPVFRFASCDIWGYEFAPHDVGRYPYATGQVYGLNKERKGKEYCERDGAVYPFYYMYPAGTEIYDLSSQMPVEECGNMLILTAAVCLSEGSSIFAHPYYGILKGWADYLLEQGADPGSQLCTDDFAGHLNHNVNLAAKAIMGIEAFSLLTKQMGNAAEAELYHGKAVEMAKDWEKRAAAGDHYRLTFDCKDSWSLKYNLVWDKLWNIGLFSEDVFEKEIDYYLTKMNTYGVPLDNRKSYTKSDWIVWCASMANKKDFKALVAPIADYARESQSRVPFSDWYDTVTGTYCHFIARSVQGGIFMPLLMSEFGKKVAE